MSYLHNTLLPLRIRRQSKTNRSKRGNMPYREAKTVAIVFTMQNLDDYEAIRSFENKLKKDGKEVKVLCYLPKNVENFHFHYDIFTNTDFSALGEVKASNITTFVEQKFDYLLCLDTASNIYIDYILAASAARFRIGPQADTKEFLYEMTIRLNGPQTVSNLIQQIIHYTNEF